MGNSHNYIFQSYVRVCFVIALSLSLRLIVLARNIAA